ncbi:MAG: DUF4032 domain-containing protein [Pyrinomonadaceae bacterium]
MFSYQLDYVIETVLKNEPNAEQKTLKKLVDQDFTKEEAAFVWGKVNDHKWYIGERLKRDVGLKVAAIDYVENFYDAGIFRNTKNKPKSFFDRIFKPVSALTRIYFVSKSRTISTF